jgi:hypothetical protein
VRRRLLSRGGYYAVWGLAGAVTGVAILLLVAATDVLRTPGDLRADDTTFQTQPRRSAGLWDVGYLPNDLSERLLEIDDDVEYREAVRLYLRIEPGKVDYRGFPELEKLRAKAQYELTRMSQADGEPKLKSRLLNMFGVLTLDSTSLNDEERQVLLRTAVSAFRNAITLDPENEPAIRNLETVLRVFGPVAISGTSPTGGKSEGEISGQGSVGSGY